MSDAKETAPRVSRRAVVASAAWSVPVITIGVAAPATAASVPVGVTAATIGTGCTLNHRPNKDLVARLPYTNNGATSATVLITAVSVTGAASTGSPSPSSFTVQAGQTQVVRVPFSTQAANETGSHTVTVQYSVDSGPPLTASVTIPSFASPC